MNDPSRDRIFRLIRCIVMHAPASDSVRRTHPIGIYLSNFFSLIIRNTLSVLCVSILLRDGGVLPFNLAIRLHQLPCLPLIIVVLNVFLYKCRILTSYRAQETNRFISIG